MSVVRVVVDQRWLAVAVMVGRYVSWRLEPLRGPLRSIHLAKT